MVCSTIKWDFEKHPSDGRTASKNRRIQMSMTKSQLERIFREFPWLWGLKQEWHHEHDIIEINVADPASFDTNVRINPYRVWLYENGKTSNDKWYGKDRHVLEESPGGWTEQLGSMVRFKANPEGLQYVAVTKPINKERNLHVRIFRPPRGKTWAELLDRYDTRDVKYRK